MLTLIASIGYGFYQVLYKKYAALPSDPECVPESGYERLSPHDEFQERTSADLERMSITDDNVHPPPFGLHANMLTSVMGIITLLVLWIPIPFLHYLGAEPFTLPKGFTILAILGICGTGVVFNAGFMVC
jgi:hypothetical protein